MLLKINSYNSNTNLGKIYDMYVLLKTLKEHFNKVYIAKTINSFTILYRNYLFYIFSLVKDGKDMLEIYLNIEDGTKLPLCFLDHNISEADNKEEYILDLSWELVNIFQDYSTKLKEKGY